jgi:CRP-like cAMP-binding protein
MENVAKLLSKTLSTFNQAEIQAILAHTQVETFQKGDIVVTQGKRCHKCYLVLKGCLRQYQLVDGEEKTTGFFVEGEPAVMYSSYLNGQPSDYYLSCVEDCVLLSGTREQEKELHQQHPTLAHLTYGLMLQDYRKAEHYIALLNGHKPEDRYLMLLETQPKLVNRVPLHLLASYLGVTPESLSRIRKRIQTHRGASTLPIK